MRVLRSRVYYKPKDEPEENIKLIEKIEELYRGDSTLGYRQMKTMLERELGINVNHKRVRSLTKLMRLKGIAPGPKNTRISGTNHINFLKHLNVKEFN